MRQTYEALKELKMHEQDQSQRIEKIKEALDRLDANFNAAEKANRRTLYFIITLLLIIIGAVVYYG